MTFIDFKKAFGSIDWSKMLKNFAAYGIPSKIVNAIRVMYKNTSALVVIPESNNDIFQMGSGVLKGDSLAPFLFIICLDYTLSTSMFSSNGLNLKRRESRKVPPKKLAELAFANDIALMKDMINKDRSLLQKIETATKKIVFFSMQARLKQCISIPL